MKCIVCISQSQHGQSFMQMKGHTCTNHSSHPPPCMCERVYLHHPWPSAEPGVEGIASPLKGQEWPQGHRTVGNCGDKLCLHYGWDRAFTSKWLWEQVLPNYLGDPGTRKGSASYQLESQLSWPPTSSLIERNNKHDKRRFC